MRMFTRLHFNVPDYSATQSVGHNWQYQIFHQRKNPSRFVVLYFDFMTRAEKNKRVITNCVMTNKTFK